MAEKVPTLYERLMARRDRVITALEEMEAEERRLEEERGFGQMKAGDTIKRGVKKLANRARGK